MEKALPFWEWKEQQIKKDTETSDCDRYLRPKEWYWNHYGRYCNKVRNTNTK